MDWHEEALCKGLTHVFFPHDSERPQAKEKRERIASTICSQCPVFEQCRQYARSNGEYGYWAGENEYDRYLAGYRLNANFGSQLRSIDAYVKRRKVKEQKEKQNNEKE